MRSINSLITAPRTSRCALAAIGAAALLLASRAVGAQELAPEAPLEPAAEPLSAAMLSPLVGYMVVVTTAEGAVHGKLVAVRDDAIELKTYPANTTVIDRAAILGVYAFAPPVAEASPPPLDRAILEAVHRTPYAISSSAPAELEQSFKPRWRTGRGPKARVVYLDDRKPSPWGGWLSLGSGPLWGDTSGPFSPFSAITIDLAVSFRFGYVGFGVIGCVFRSGGLPAPVFEDKGHGRQPNATGAYLEAGITKGLFLHRRAHNVIELRPSIGYGALAMSSVSQDDRGCASCETARYDYNGAPYVRLQLGAFFTSRRGLTSPLGFTASNGPFAGATVSFQEFLFGQSPRLHQALTFGLTAGFGP